MALQPDDLLGDAALQAAVAALAERNHHHLADMSDDERTEAVAALGEQGTHELPERAAELEPALVERTAPGFAAFAEIVAAG